MEGKGPSSMGMSKHRKSGRTRRNLKAEEIFFNNFQKRFPQPPAVFFGKSIKELMEENDK